VVLSGQIRIPDVEGVLVRLQSDEWPITVSSEGEIFTTVQPIEKLAVVVEAPGYRPPRWVHQIRPDEARDGHIRIDTPVFTPATGIFLAKPQLGTTPRSAQ
jgi:hypothetical protein